MAISEASHRGTGGSRSVPRCVLSLAWWCKKLISGEITQQCFRLISLFLTGAFDVDKDL